MKTSHTVALIILIAIIVISMIVFSQDNPDVSSQQASALSAVSSAMGIQRLDAEQFMEMSKESGVTLIDIRTKGEYDAGHIDGSINIDYYGSDFADQLERLDKNKPYLIYCRSGNRSGQALEMMKDLGFENVADLLGGYVALKQ